MATITPNLQKFIDAAKELECVISLEVLDPPEYVLSQVEDKDCVFLDYIVKGDRGTGEEPVEIAFLVPNRIIDGDSYKQLPFEHLFNCPCPDMENSGSLIAGHSPLYNRGKLIYFVRPPNMDFVILHEMPPELVIIKSEPLQVLEKKLLALDKVNNLAIEYIKDPKVIASMDCERPLMVVANIDIIDKINPKVKTYNVCFAISELIYEIEENHYWAIDNLQELIEKSNVAE
jgi:hypothetical protein